MFGVAEKYMQKRSDGGMFKQPDQQAALTALLGNSMSRQAAAQKNQANRDNLIARSDARKATQAAYNDKERDRRHQFGMQDARLASTEREGAATRATQHSIQDMLSGRRSGDLRAELENRLNLQGNQLDVDRERMQGEFGQMDADRALRELLGMGQLDVQNRGLDVQRELGLSDVAARMLGLDVQRELGMGELALGGRELDQRGRLADADRQLREKLGMGDLDLRGRGLDLQAELGRRSADLSEQELALRELLGLENVDLQREDMGLRRDIADQQFEEGRADRALRELLGRGELDVRNRGLDVQQQEGAADRQSRERMQGRDIESREGMSAQELALRKLLGMQEGDIARERNAIESRRAEDWRRVQDRNADIEESKLTDPEVQAGAMVMGGKARSRRDAIKKLTDEGGSQAEDIAAEMPITAGAEGVAALAQQMGPEWVRANPEEFRRIASERFSPGAFQQAVEAEMSRVGRQGTMRMYMPALWLTGGPDESWAVKNTNPYTANARGVMKLLGW